MFHLLPKDVILYLFSFCQDVSLFSTCKLLFGLRCRVKTLVLRRGRLCRNLSSFEQLERLFVRQASPMDLTWFRQIFCLRQLRHLNLTGCSSLHRVDPSGSQLSCLSSLVLDATKIDCDWISSRLPLLLACPSVLHSVSFRGCHRLKTAGLLALARWCSNLQHLNVSGIAHLDIAIVVQALPRLEQLDCRGGAFWSARQNYPKRLDASNATGVVDVSACCSQMEWLLLQGTSISSVAKVCVQSRDSLTRLSLMECPNMSFEEEILGCKVFFQRKNEGYSRFLI